MIKRDSQYRRMDDMDIIEKELKKIDENQQSCPKSDILMEVCPVCGEPDLTYYRMSAGGIIFGLSAEQRYRCKNCGYIGSVSIEIKSRDDIKKIKENYKIHKESQKQNPGSEQSIDQKPELLNPDYKWFFRGILMIMIIIYLVLLLRLGISALY